MGYVVMFDPELQIAVLVDPTGPHALGPAVRGEGSDRILDAFVDGLEQDPTELTAFELATLWASFLAVMGYDPEQAAEGSEEPGGVAELPPFPAGSPPVESTSPTLESGAPPADRGDLDSEPPPPPSWPPCPNCQSTKREALADGSQVCATCGEVLQAAG